MGSLTPLSEDEPPSSATLSASTNRTKRQLHEFALHHQHRLWAPSTYHFASRLFSLALDPIAFLAPPNSGLNTVYARSATEEELAETNCQHRLLCEDFNLYYTPERALKTLLVAAMPHLFIAELYDEALGWGTTTTLQLLTHLHTTYGGIDEDMLAENLERIKTPWSPPTSIDTLFYKLSRVWCL